ncbi:MAG: right-handed parallel beta-helix repeat-containing protein [Planctomycetia bacterium]|nr:right-handed parallel beta-helix repeat-containing protein [Planctomycetia bacterium]
MALAACGLLASLACLPATAHAQAFVSDGSTPGGNFLAPLSVPGLERFWVGFVGADRGLGYTGSYGSIGGLLPITTDMLDGTWFFDGRGHIAVEQGRFFGNFGIGRRAYFDPFLSVLGVSGWYDYDGDQFSGFGHSFNQMGVTGEVFNSLFDFRFNGYWPVGNNNYLFSPSTFYQHNILAINGIDSALKGFDAKFSFRPGFLGVWNGYFDIGGYGYKSDLIPSFGGVSTGFGVQPLPGLAINMEVDHDHVFDWTGFIRVAFGLGGTPGNSRTQNRILEPTRRNDHIVRFNQQPVLAINPDTGLPWVVQHVDNSATGTEDGTVNHPYRTLAAGETNSAPNDIIFVRAGDGTSTGYDTGVQLQNFQQLLGDGITHIINTQFGPQALSILVPNKTPVITNLTGPAVTLANHNVVSGFDINFAQTGILGDGIVGASIHNNTFQTSGINSVQIQNSTGVVDIRDNFFFQPGEDGIRFVNFNGTGVIIFNRFNLAGHDSIDLISSTGTFDIRSNTINGSVHDAIHFQDVTGTAGIVSNTIEDNGVGNGSGFRVQNAAAGTLDVEIRDNTVQNNAIGLVLEANGAGATINTTIERNPHLSNQAGDGIQIAARFGGTVNFSITDNPNISENGLVNGSGQGIRLFAEDGTLNGFIARNTLFQNAGGPPSNGLVDKASEIGGVFNGDSHTNLTIRENSLTGNETALGIIGPEGNAIFLQYNVTNTAVQQLRIEGNTIQQEGHGVIMLVADTTVLDSFLNDNIIANNVGDAVFLAASDSSLVRVIANGNTITNNDSPAYANLNASAVNLFATDTARVIGIFTNNNIQQNAGSVFANGISGRTFNSSQMVLEIFNNNLSNNGNHGVRLEVNDGSTMVALLRDNVIKDNDGTGDVDARIQLFGLAAANMCLELTSNVSTSGYILRNLGAAGATFDYTDNGLNTGTIDVGNNVTLQAAGTCAAAAVPLLVFP